MRQMFVFGLSVVLLSGCDVAPDEVCQQLAFLMDGKKEANPQCVTHWQKKKNENAKAYSCYAKCVMKAKRQGELGDCLTNCYPNTPKPRDETENIEKIFWVPDSGQSAVPSGSTSNTVGK